VLRSPGIRSALEHQLEKISVFEHSKCNKGRQTYAYRQIQIREKTYYALSRVSDAGNDYSGRTNFLAHHLVFEKEELPELSPADILLNWPGWCQNWSGDPREEAVDIQSLQQTQAIKPPVQLWKEQAAGLDGALKLANDTQSALTLRSQGCSDEMLLQLIGEVFAVRAAYNKSYRYTWTTSFSVGLATASNAKNFKWLVLRASDDYALSSSGTLMDLDAPLSGGVQADEELTAIASEGQYSPAPKPIPLDSGPSVLDTLTSAPSGRGKVPPGQRGGQSRKIESRPLKLGNGKQLRADKVAPKKKKNRTALSVTVCIVLAIIFGGGYFLYQEWHRDQIINESKESFEELIELHDKSLDGPVSTDDVKTLIASILRAAEPSLGTDDRKDYVLKLHYSDDSFKRDKARTAFEVYWNYVHASPQVEKITNLDLQEKETSVMDDKSDKKSETADKPKVVNDEQRLEEPPPAKEEKLVPLDLGQFAKIELRQRGEELKIEASEHSSSSFKASNEMSQLKVLSAKHLSHAYNIDVSTGKALVPENQAHGRFVPINVFIANISRSYAIQISPRNGKPSLAVVVGKDWPYGLKLGELNIKRQTGRQVLDTIEERFTYNPDRIEIHLFDADNVRVYEPVKPGGSASVQLSDEIEILKPCFELMAKKTVEGKISDQTINQFEEWVAEQVVSELNDLVEKKSNERKNEEEDSKKEKLSMAIEAYKELITKIGKAKQTEKISSYFEGYKDTLEMFKSKRTGGVDSKKKRILNGAEQIFINSLPQDKFKRNTIILSANGSEQNSVTFEIRREDDEWTFQYKASGNEFQKPRNASHLKGKLLEYVSKLKIDDTVSEERLVYDKQSEDFNEERKWGSVKMVDSKSKQVIATVDLK
jgi:hypothetical protein